MDTEIAILALNGVVYVSVKIGGYDVDDYTSEEILVVKIENLH